MYREENICTTGFGTAGRRRTSAESSSDTGAAILCRDGSRPWRLGGLAHEPLTSSAHERHRLGEKDAHRVTERDCLLVDAALRLHLLQGRRGQFDRGIERERRELLPLRLLHRLGLLLGELAQSAH